MNNETCREMPFYAKEYKLTDELKKYNFLNKKTFTSSDCLLLRKVLKKDLDITMRYLSEDRKMGVLNSMNLSYFGCMKNNCNKN